jgi:hypothetical protein
MVLHNPRACAEQAAVFGFHQARSYNPVTLQITGVGHETNKMLWEGYPEKVRARLGQLTPQIVWIKGTELLPECK